jgi:hypothetical protein
MKYLKRAELYAFAHGDELWFKNLYSQFREFNDVQDSVWRTLSYLYSNRVADQLQSEL